MDAFFNPCDGEYCTSSQAYTPWTAHASILTVFVMPERHVVAVFVLQNYLEVDTPSLILCIV